MYAQVDAEGCVQNMMEEILYYKRYAYVIGK